jgi:hypothetical protein
MNNCNICGLEDIGFKRKLCNKCRRKQKKIRNSRRNNKKEYIRYKEKHSLNMKLLLAKSPEKYKARRLLYKYLKDNNIKLYKCVLCGNKNNLVAHHDDYSKPLEYRTLCKSCHGNLHKRGVYV